MKDPRYFDDDGRRIRLDTRFLEQCGRKPKEKKIIQVWPIYDKPNQRMLWYYD